MTRNILITGASGGFGALTVKELLKRGKNVAATMRNSNTRNKEVAEELTSLGAHIVDMDVTDDASVDRAVSRSIELLGGLDVVIKA